MIKHRSLAGGYFLLGNTSHSISTYFLNNTLMLTVMNKRARVYANLGNTKE